MVNAGLKLNNSMDVGNNSAGGVRPIIRALPDAGIRILSCDGIGCWSWKLILDILCLT